MRWTAVALAVLVLASGCLASSSTEPAESMEDEARDAVTDRLEDPQLVQLWGIEPPSHARETGEELVTHLDDEAGDGQAPGWAYHFEGEGWEAIVLTAAEVGVIAEFYERHAEGEAPEQPLADRSVSSQAAAEALRANGSWPTMNTNTTVAWQLVQAEGGEDTDHEGPLWAAHVQKGITDPFDDGLVGVVDAQTGEVLEIGESEDGGFGPASPAGGGCDQDAASGQVTPTQELTATVQLEATGQITAEATRNAGVGELNVTLEGPNGTLWTTTFDGAGSAGRESSHDDQPAGEYTLTASTADGAHDVELQLRGEWGTGGTCPDVQVGPSATTHPAARWLVGPDTAPWTR